MDLNYIFSAEEQPLYNRTEPRTVSTSLDTREGISSGRGPQVIVPRRIALEGMDFILLKISPFLESVQMEHVQ